MYKFVRPEVVAGILDEFIINEGDQESPRVWPVHNQSLQQHTRMVGRQKHAQEHSRWSRWDGWVGKKWLLVQ